MPPEASETPAGAPTGSGRFVAVAEEDLDRVEPADRPGTR